MAILRPLESFFHSNLSQAEESQPWMRVRYE
jgi:hypothetical protein